MNPDIAETYASTLEQLAAQLRADNPKPAEPPPPTVYETAETFKTALAAAQPGDTVLVSPSLIYIAPLVPPVGVTVKNSAFIDGLVPEDFPCPTFMTGATVKDGACLLGLEIRHPDPTKDIVTVTGKDWIVRGCRISGDLTKGAKRGIAANGPNGVIQNNRIDHCFGTYPGKDSQAICAWDTPGPLLIQGNYLRGGSETIMIGGSDPSSDANIPSDVAILDNYIGADPNWQPLAIGVKSRLEIKNCKRLLIQGNRIEYCWGKHGQDGYLLTLNVRNQDGRAPFSTIEDVVIYDNDFAHGAAGINILGQDNRVGFPSQRMKRVSITGNRFTDLDPVKYSGGTAKLIMLMEGATDVQIDGNQFAGVGLSSAVFFSNGKYDGLSIRSNTFPKTTYVFFGNNIGQDLTKIKAAFLTSGDLSGNVVQ